jgi:dihydrofolate reductase
VFLSLPSLKKRFSVNGDVVNAVAKLKEQPGEDLLIYGSSSLVNALLPTS